jgi:uncharacterized membrane protein
VVQTFFNYAPIADILLIYHIPIVAYCLIYFYENLLRPKPEALTSQAGFWLVSAFFFYHLVSYAYWAVYFYFNDMLSPYISIISELNVILATINYALLWVSIAVYLRSKKPNAGRPKY